MIQKSLKTTRIIYKVLEANELVNSLVNTNIFLIIAEEGTNFPYVTVTRTGISSNTDINDDFNPDIVNFRVSVYSDKYEDAENIADAVRGALERNIFTDEIIISEIYLLNATEDFSISSDTYIQNLDFRCEVETNDSWQPPVEQPTDNQNNDNQNVDNQNDDNENL